MGVSEASAPNRVLQAATVDKVSTPSKAQPSDGSYQVASPRQASTINPAPEDAWSNWATLDVVSPQLHPVADAITPSLVLASSEPEDVTSALSASKLNPATGSEKGTSVVEVLL